MHRISKSTLLKLASLPFYYFAIRYAAHGRSMSKTPALVVGLLLFVAAVALTITAFRIERRTS